MSRLGCVIVGLSVCVSAWGQDAHQILPLAVKLNGTFVTKDKDSDYLIDVVEMGDKHYLSVSDLADIISIHPTKTQAGYEFDTPIGVATLAKERLYELEGQDHIALDELKTMGIHASYSPSELAIIINMGYKAKSAKPTIQKVAITHKPKAFGLISAYADFDINERHTKDSTTSQLSTNMGAFGYALGGVWGVDMRHYADTRGTLGQLNFRGDDRTHLNNAYWSTSGERFATRLGVNQSSTSVRGVGEYTGVGVAYSSQSIDRHLSALGTHTKSLLQGQYNDLQTITGQGMAGGVAELRISGAPVARVLIGLDGRYEFLNLDVGRLDTDTTLVEVALYEYPQASQPVRIERIFVGKRRSRVATGEWLMEAGVGRAGNAFDDALQNTNAKDRLTSDVYAEYGLSNRVAVKAGLGVVYDDQNRSQHSHYAGINFTPIKYINADIGYWHTPTQNSLIGDVRYERKHLSANYTLERHHDKGADKNDTLHSLYAHYRPSDKLSLNLSHYEYRHHAKDDYRQTQVNIDTTISPQLSAGAYWYSLHDRYGYRLLWSDKDAINRVGIQGDEDGQELSIWHKLSHRTALGLSITHQDGQDLLYHGFVNHQASERSAFDVGYSAYRGQFGVRGAWQYRPTDGVQVALGYQSRYTQGLSYGADEHLRDIWQDKHYVYAKVRFDFYKPHKKPPRLGYYPHQQNGTVMVNLSHPEGLHLESDNIRFGLSQINTDKPHQRPVSASLLGKTTTSSQYLITNVPIGDYELGLDARHLPFEYITENLPKPTLRLGRYAPTLVDFKLTKTYGLTGRLSDGQEGVMIEIWQGDKRVGQMMSDEMGDFQQFELSDGVYTLTSAGYQPLTISIDGDVVMNVVMIKE